MLEVTFLIKYRASVETVLLEKGINEVVKPRFEDLTFITTGCMVVKSKVLQATKMEGYYEPRADYQGESNTSYSQVLTLINSYSGILMTK